MNGQVVEMQNVIVVIQNRACITDTFFSQSHLVTQLSHHTVISSQASIVQSYGWAMLNYAGKAGEVGEAGNGYTDSFVAVAIFQDIP